MIILAHSAVRSLTLGIMKITTVVQGFIVFINTPLFFFFRFGRSIDLDFKRVYSLPLYDYFGIALLSKPLPQRI